MVSETAINIDPNKIIHSYSSTAVSWDQAFEEEEGGRWKKEEEDKWEIQNGPSAERSGPK